MRACESSSGSTRLDNLRALLSRDRHWHINGVFTPIRIAALFGAAAVALGAFGSHGLKTLLEANQTVEVWKTASLYHLLHSVVLLVLATLPSLRRRAFQCFGTGILIFSGSLYGLAVSQIKILGAITPIGGLFLIAGWLLLGGSGSASGGARKD